MPDSVSILEDRTVMILEGVKRAFAEKGFDGASMQDLAREAQMSVGNFYRYFPSKNAIVEAMIARDLADVQRDFERVRSSDDQAQALVEIMRHRLDTLDCADGPLWAEIDAAAIRRPEIGKVVQRMEATIGGFLTLVFAAIAGITPQAAEERFAGHASFLILLFKGASLRLSGKGCHIPDQTRIQMRELIFKAIDQTLAEVAAARGGIAD